MSLYTPLYVGFDNFGNPGKPSHNRPLCKKARIGKLNEQIRIVYSILVVRIKFRACVSGSRRWSRWLAVGYRKGKAARQGRGEQEGSWLCGLAALVLLLFASSPLPPMPL